MVKRTIKKKTLIAFQLILLLILKTLKMNFKNKKILITGATGGIGQDIVEKFVSLEAKVIATGTNESKLNILKKFSQIHTERFKLDDHDKIEQFIDNVHKI